MPNGSHGPDLTDPMMTLQPVTPAHHDCVTPDKSGSMVQLQCVTIA